MINNNNNAIRIPWMLSIWPNFNAAPLILHRVLTILSAFASDRNGLPASSAILGPVTKQMDNIDQFVLQNQLIVTAESQNCELWVAFVFPGS